jgi:hypothetical protein
VTRRTGVDGPGPSRSARALTPLAAFAFRLDRESLRPLWTVPLQQVVYRQLMYLVVIQSLAAALAGTRLRWHKLRRLGLAGAPAGVRTGIGAGPGTGYDRER